MANYRTQSDGEARNYRMFSFTFASLFASLTVISDPLSVSRGGAKVPTEAAVVEIAGSHCPVGPGQ